MYRSRYVLSLCDPILTRRPAFRSLHSSITPPRLINYASNEDPRCINNILIMLTCFTRLRAKYFPEHFQLHSSLKYEITFHTCSKNWFIYRKQVWLWRLSSPTSRYEPVAAPVNLVMNFAVPQRHKISWLLHQISANIDFSGWTLKEYCGGPQQGKENEADQLGNVR
jgi:hypothetical protein